MRIVSSYGPHSVGITRSRGLFRKPDIGYATEEREHWLATVIPGDKSKGMQQSTAFSADESVSWIVSVMAEWAVEEMG
jgi:hypothetical protein